MNTDDTGRVRAICDRSALDEIQIPVILPSQEDPDRFS